MKEQNTPREKDIAIIGMSGRFPGAQDLESFWKNLSEGLETISTFTDEELRESGIDEELIASPNYIPRRGILGNAQDFDAHFFDFTPRDAEIMDPQHRVFLETSWHAFEDAGYVPSTYPGKVGVFGGTGTAWHLNKVQAHPGVSQFASGASVVTNNDKDYVTTRVSYKLNLKGPSVNVQTACSTAMVAVVMGVNSLLSGESDLIVAGGVSIDTPERQGYKYMEGGMESADGRCYAFDSRANGTVFSRGVGVVLLKRLTDAVRDGDHIYSVIKGGAINNDGSLKAGFTAPGIEGQVDVAKQAITNSDIDVENIRFVEAHGTATALGDPIEFSSLSQTFRHYTDKEQFCRLGSVKTNIGHTDAASGVASLIKASLSLQKGELPASLHFASPNPNIEFEGSPFVIHTETGAFNEKGKPSNALVNSFGVGGTNACVILETAPVSEPSADHAAPVVIPLSARSRSALNDMKQRLATFLDANPHVDLADAAYTMQLGRKQFEFSTAVAGKDREALISALEANSPVTVNGANSDRPVVFMFPGQGNQYPNMARDLYQTYDVFKKTMDACCDYLTPILDQDLREIIFPDTPDAEKKINETQYTQPALFVVEYSLAQLWMSWGITPDIMIGHSVGEYVAACLSGVFSMEDALKAVAIRGQLVQALPAGAMLAVLMDEETLTARLAQSDLDIAAVNYPELCVVAGELEAIKAFQYELEEEGIFCKHLDTSHGFHSSMMDPMLPAFKDVIDGIELHAPSIPFVSSVNGQWITDELAQDSDYWVRHVRNPVLFSHAFKTLMADNPDGMVCLEVGPGRSLESAAKQHLREDEQIAAEILASLPTAKEVAMTGEHFAATIGALWACGVSVDWASLYDGKRQRISLPGYPFERKEFKLPDSLKNTADVHSSAGAEQALKRKKDNVADWFYMPAWKRTIPADFLANKRHDSEGTCWVLFADEYGVANEIKRQLCASGQQVIVVFKGDSYQVDVLSSGEPDSFIINPSSRDDYVNLLRTIKEQEVGSVRIINLWNLSLDGNSVGVEAYREGELNAFYSPLYIQQALVNEDLLKDMHLVLVSNNIFSIAGESVHSPEKALLIGPSRVFYHEYPEVQCHLVDIDWPTDQASWNIKKAASCLIAESHIATNGELVAYRGGCRWQEDYQAVKISQEIQGIAADFKDDGVYVITGGLGGLGMLVAEHVSDLCNGTLVLTYRTSLPPREQWHEWIKSHPVDDPMSAKLAGILRLEENGNKVDLAEVDVCDYQGMSDVFARYDHVDGVFHTAGIAGGGIIPLKTDEDCASVLDSKVKGALILDDLTKDSQPDFMILFSSITALVGDEARIDYCSGNAFLDAFAHYRNQNRNGRTVAINWGKWGDVGMAVKWGKELDEKSKDAKESVTQDSHALLQFLKRKGMDEEYAVNLDVNKDWVIDEHCLSKQPTLVGTTILSLLHSLISEFKPQETLQVKSLLLTKPVIYHHAWPRELRLFVKAEGTGYSFSLRSRGVKEVQWEEHAIGSIGNKQDVIGATIESVDTILNRCTSKLPADPLPLDYKNTVSNESFLSLSERWNCVKDVWKGQDEWLIHKDLSSQFQGDFARYAYHPAVIDAVSIRCINDITQANFLPISYGNISYLAPLDVDCYAHIHMKQAYSEQDNTIMVDVVFLSASNEPLLVLENYTLVKMNASNQVDNDKATQSAPIKVDLSDKDILYYEGLDALKRQLAHLEFEQLFVITSDLNQLIFEAIPEQEDDNLAALEAQASQGHARPELTVEYVAPDNDIEKEIASVWQSVLGISGIGVNDNFVELGGNSLLAVQVVSKVSAKFEVGIRVDLFYQNQTIKGLASQVFDAFEALLQAD